jgi:hypothetical protein
MDGFKKCTSRPAPSVCRFLQQNRQEADIPKYLGDVRYLGEQRKTFARIELFRF